MQEGLRSITDSVIQTLNGLISGDTVVGKSIQTANGETIIPISKVSFGIVSAGKESDEQSMAVGNYPLLLGGGSGATVTPVCFLILNKYGAKLLRIDAEDKTSKWLELINSVIKKVF